MFKIRKIDHRPWPVTVTLLVCCALTGAVSEETHTFVVNWRPFSESDLGEIRRRIYGPGSDDDHRAAAAARTIEENARLDTEFLAQFVQGWEGVVDASNQPVAWSRDVFDALCLGEDGPAIRRALHTALTELRFGIPAQKNSLTSPSPGPTPSAAGEA